MKDKEKEYKAHRSVRSIMLPTDKNSQNYRIQRINIG